MGRSWRVVFPSVLALVVLSVLITWTQAPRPGAAAEWNEAVSRLLERSDDGAPRELVPARENTRRAGVYLGLLISGLLALLYAYRRQRYILEWVGVWLLLSLAAYLIARGYANAAQAGAAVAVLEVAKVASALLIVQSAHSFLRAPAVSARLQWLLVPSLVVWLAATEGRLSPAVVLAPAYVLTGLILLRAAALFAAAARAQKALGALLLAVALAIVGGSNLLFGLFFERALSSGPTVLLFLSLSTVCFLMVAFAMTVLIFEDVTSELRATVDRLHEARQRVETLATVDALTGCYNRRFLEQHIGRELRQHRRYGTPLSLLFVDVDHLKRINDQHGHQAGDRALTHVAQVLTRSVRATDFVVRWGGDEFLVLMQCSAAEAAAKAALLGTEIRGTSAASSLPEPVSASIGWVEIPADATDLAPFIEVADRGMYQQKRAAGAL